ncbi:MAG: hypothetical protein HRU12_09700, partial [Phaeodactylibacter sp.]|nr:hypothetical protein [Phaeodactylibacter sp.]
MDLQALKAGAAQFAGLASMELPTLPERKDPDPFRKYSCEPIGLEEFAAQLKDSITDPISGKEVTLSQSRIKSFLQMIEDELCGKQV